MRELNYEKLANRDYDFIVVTTVGDLTSKHVVDWLKYYGTNVRMLYTDVEGIGIENIYLSNEEDFFEISTSTGERLTDKKKKVVFFRRGMLRLFGSTNSYANPGDFSDIANRVKYFFTTYELSQRELVNFFFTKGYKIGNDNGSRINKIVNLKKAKEIGLTIPETLVTTSKSKLKEWFEGKNGVITKALDIGMFFGDVESKKMYQQLTKPVCLDEVNQFPDRFPPTLFQERVNKVLELRVFYIGGKSWASAIISQNQTNTQEDYRNYNPEKMNRVVPYMLPKEITTKIDSYMNYICLESGSLDLILSDDGKYYFLEVNPSGQFGAISEKCNYNLEREIAKNMIENES